ncbi:aldo/keto reductase [Notoacmeibacter ruber]|uniref:Aldo/keto reductase n=2 Tax=Notoacmeibacter ruber TaxID=2670375 RepID=A0A3L7J9A5_9HYPH|nr:aldo/keto reductase [Notoacmeibacter ruber]
MMFGDQTDEDEASEILDRYFTAGGNFVDTADMYSAGASEAMLGRLSSRLPEGTIIATKVGNRVGSDERSGGLSPDWIREAAARSLDRLERKQIDLYYLHLDDPSQDLAATIDALGELLADHRIRAWGFSNFPAWKIAELVRLADAAGVDRPVAAQPLYHMLNREAEAGFIPACRHFGMSVVSYSPLARGVLTGKYATDGAPPPGSRAGRGDKRILQTEFRPETLQQAAAAAEYARESGRNPAHLAIRWVLANDAVTSVLAGPRTVSQIEGYLEALKTRYDSADEEMLSSLCIPGKSAAPGAFDPKYPPDGRHLR